jgi:hypothetical protein
MNPIIALLFSVFINFPVNQWTLKVGPNDGGFRIHPLDPDRWFLGSENRGVFVTFDAGTTWDQVI